MAWTGMGGRNRNPYGYADYDGQASLSATAAAFVPGGAGGALSSGAQASLSAGSEAFVPGQAWSTDAWQGTEQYDAWGAGGAGDWQQGAFPPAFEPGAASYGGGSWEKPAAVAWEKPAACMLNLDAFDSDSSSSSSSPRGPPPQQRPGDPQANGAAAAAAAVALGPVAAATAAATAAVEAEAVPLAEASTAPSCASTPRPSPALQPAGATSGGIATGVPASPALSASGLHTPCESENTALETASEWSVQDEGQTRAPGVEISDKELKRWLQFFADDGDTAALGGQWRTWTSLGGGADRKVAAWLVRAGLDDSRVASDALSVLRRLVGHEGLPQDVVLSCLGEYSDDDVEDLRLDNPRVDDFLASLRTPLVTEPVLDVAAGTKPAEPLPISGNGHVAQLGADGVYPLVDLLAIWRCLAAVQGGLSPEPGMPVYRTEAAAGVAPAPQWAQRSQAGAASGARAREQRAESEASSQGGLWRTTSSRSAGGKEPLQISGTSWVAQVRRMKEARRNLDEDAEADERFLRELRSVLNKLTIEKFEPLSEQIMLLISQSSRPNRGIPTLMQLIFEKATTQHHFINMYVNLCSKLHRWLTDSDQLTEFASQANFKRILLNQCQASFEQYLEPPEGFDGLRGDELYEAQVKYKTKMLGNIKLVGALIRHGMLAPKIAVAVASELVRDDPVVLEERLETLTVFLETVGPCLDDASWSHFADLDKIFREVERIVSDGQVAARIRFLLRDVLDMRRGRWQVQKVRDVGSDAPMRLSEVHEKARQDQTPTSGRSSQGGGSTRHRPSSGSASGRGRPPTLADVSGAAFVGASPSAGSQAGASSGPQRQRSGSGCAAPRTPERRTPGSPLQGPQGNQLSEAAHGFRKEAAQALRQISSGSFDKRAMLQRMKRLGSLSLDSAIEEARDFISRAVDAPRPRRLQAFELLAALSSGSGVISQRALKQAIEGFVKDAFVDPRKVDPPDLADIILWELLPAVDVQPGSLRLPKCLSSMVT